VKPGLAIDRLLVQRFALDPGRCVYIDDSQTNAAAAALPGMHAIHFTSPDILADEHCEQGFAVARHRCRRPEPSRLYSNPMWIWDNYILSLYEIAR
jgi:FMN phosphatase YigB (HAD superfamily)